MFSNGDIVFVNSDNVTLFSDDMGLATIDLNNIWPDDDNFDDETIIHVKLVAWCNRYKQHKALKKEISKELMPVAWHPARRWEWCM